MAQITWRDVAQPNFNSPGDGFAQFSKLLGDSLGGLKSAVGGFDQSKSDLVNNQLALALAQQPNAAAAQAAIASGQVGGLNLNDPSFLRRISATNLAAISPDAIAKLGQEQIQTSSDQTRLGADQLSLGQSQINAGQRAARDAAAPQFAAADAALRAGDRGKAEQILGAIDYTKFGAGAVGDISRGVQTTESTQLNDRSSRFAQGNAEEDRVNETEASRLFSTIRAGALSGDDARLLYNDPNGPAAKLNPRARANLEAKLSAQYPDIFGSAGGGGSLGGAGGGGAAVGGSSGGDPYNIVIGGKGLGLQPTKPVTEMTLAEARDFGKNVLIPGTRGNKSLGLSADQGSSAIGAYQILAGSTLETYAKKLGLDLATTKFTPQVQEQIAKAIFEDNKGGNLKAQWTSLPNATPGAYKDKTWEEVRGLIARGESAATPAQLISQAADANVGIALRGIQDSDGLDFDLATTIGDNRNVAQVADSLIAAGDGKGGPSGVLRGTSRAFMLDKINDVMRRANVNAATAGAMIERSVVGSDAEKPFERLIRQASGGSPNLGGNARLDDRALNERVQRLKSTDIRKEVAATRERAQASALSSQAAQAVAQAQQNLVQARLRAVTQPGLAPVLAKYEAELAAASAKLEALKDNANGQAYQPSTGRPVPVARQVRKEEGTVVSRLLSKYTDGK